MSESQEKYLVIGCEAVLNELQKVADSRRVSFRPIDAGLHLHPEKLQAALQQAIDDQGAAYEAILLGFGLCSNAVVGLKSEHSLLVVPRVDDCIGMLLGSQERYRAEMATAPGTYFLSKGWIDAGVTLMDEYKQMAERFGEERARKLQAKMFGHYTRLAYIASLDGDQTAYREFSRKAADFLSLNYQELQGTDKLLKAMVSGQWDEGFVVVPPGQTITLADFKAPAKTS